LNKERPIKVCIDTKHLAEQILASILELTREAAAPAYPILSTKSRQRRVEARWGSRDWCIRSRRIETTKRIGRCLGCRDTSIPGPRNSVGVSRENGIIVDLCHNPASHKGGILVGGNLLGFATFIEPGIEVCADCSSQ